MNHSSSSNSSKMVMNCNCGIPATIKTSWTFQNPSRKFATCKFYNLESEMRGCSFFEWVDEDMTEWQRKLINQLLNENKCLKNQLSQHKLDDMETKKSSEVNGKKLESICNELVIGFEQVKKDNKRYKLALIFVIMFIVYVKLGY
ncbi:hypothetical protein RND81_01G107700 [Saponaria officinalis]|uniref:GRF-type domain-containing protein n=1 Tax=Saponaria officinalis TaxID=3572 RepID=A0AAW1NG18_SAPOF